MRKASYGVFERKRRLQQKYCKDRRKFKRAYSKISRNYHNKVSTTLHQVSRSIVEWCKANEYGLIHENLNELRKSVNKKVKRFNKFNGKVQLISKRSKRLKRRLNNWWFKRFLNQIAYKCTWEGIKVTESKHKGSSSICPICGFKLEVYPNRTVKCLKCSFKCDRDTVACLNLLRWEGVVHPQPQPPLKCSREASPNKALFELMRKRRGAKEGKLHHPTPKDATEPKWEKFNYVRGYVYLIYLS